MVLIPSLPDTFLPAETAVKRVDQFMRRVDFSVDGIPPSWDLELTIIKNRVEQIDLDAQRLLAFLLTWYSPRFGRARFSGPAVNVSYKLLQTRFQFAKNRVEALLHRMDEEHQVIHRYSRGLGKGKGAVLYIIPNMDRVEEITYPVQVNTVTGELKRTVLGTPVSGGPYSITTLRRHETDAAAVDQWEDEDAVHIISLAKRIPVDPLDPMDQPSGADAAARAQCLAVPDACEGPVASPGGSSSGGDCPEPADRTAEAEESRSLEADAHVSTLAPHRAGCEPDHTTGHATPAQMQTLLQSTTPDTRPGAVLSRPPGHRPYDRHPTNAPAPVRTNADELKLSHQLALFRWLYVRELERTTNVNVRRAVVRRAWQAACRLLPHELSSDAVYNAWQRLQRTGIADPALDLLGVAVVVCGRCTGPLDERIDVAHRLLRAVGRKDATDAVDPASAQDPSAVGSALRTALLHRLDSNSLPWLVRHVCRLDKKQKTTHAFTYRLIRRYATHDVPFNPALFAGAVASVVQDHLKPTAEALVGACEREASLYLHLRVQAWDDVRLGSWSLWINGVDPHAAVVSLGTLPNRGNEREVWDRVDEVRTERGRTVAVTKGGSIVGLCHAEVRKQGEEELVSLAQLVDRTRA